MLRSTQARFTSGRPITENLLACTAVLSATYMDAELWCGWAGISSQPEMAAHSWSQEMCLLLHWVSLSSQTFFPPSLPFKQKAFFFLWVSDALQYWVCDRRLFSSSSSHCYFQRKGCRHAAGVASHVSPSSEAADGENNVLEKSRAGLAGTGVWPSVAALGAWTPPAGQELGALSAQRSLAKGSSAFNSERFRRA